MAQGTTVKVAGPLIVAENMADARMYEDKRRNGTERAHGNAQA